MIELFKRIIVPGLNRFQANIKMPIFKKIKMLSLSATLLHMKLTGFIFICSALLFHAFSRSVCFICLGGGFIYFFHRAICIYEFSNKYILICKTYLSS